MEARRWLYILHRESVEEDTWRNSTTIITGIRREQYVDFHSEEVWVQQKVEEEAAAIGALLPDDLQLMAIVSGRLDRGRLYGTGSEVAHLKVESSLAAVGLLPYCLEVEQRIMRWVEAVVSSVCTSHD
ncbi:hypothetical protein M9H77_06301 [Catharanthus roseus]|uniref:Uncharacterized protein n=1 Tax=Catharanthus roseus TaxID=4058 RepID=A0ACC0BRR8_CATRO|nr:hypothetical protein M9H77_06301 [Catharanthus roseus]